MEAAKTIASLVAKLSLDSSEFTKGMDKVKSSMSIKEAVSTTGKAFAMVGGAAAAAVGVTAKAAIDFEDAFIGVRKTVEAPIGTNANDFFNSLKQDIFDMSSEVPSSLEAIAGVYEIGGQLGIEAENLTSFSRSMIDIANSTNLTEEAASVGFARLANITKTAQTEFSNLGSSVVSLGNNLATSESEILDITQNIALAGTNAGISAPQLLGWGGAMKSLGLEAASAGTAFSRFTNDVVRNVANGGGELEILAKTAGMTAADFKKSFETDASGAIQTFLAGLGKMGSAEQLAVFDALDIAQMREIETLGALANNQELVAKALNLSTTAYVENTALSDEAAQRYAGLKSQLGMFRNELSKVAIVVGEALMPSIRSLLDWIKPIVQKFAAWAKQNPELITGLLKAGIAIGALGIAMLGVLKVISAFKTIGSVFKAFSSIGKLGSVFTSLGGAITKLGSVFLTAGKAVLGFIAGLNPIILIIGAIIAVVALLYAAWKNNWLGMRDILTNFWENTLQPFFQKIGDWLAKIPAWFQEAAGNIRQFLNSIGGWFKQAFADIGSFFSGIGSWFSNAFSGIADWVSNAFVGVIDWFTSAPTKIGDAISTWWTGIQTSLQKFKDDFLADIEKFDLKTAIENLASKIGEGISGWWENVKTSITEFLDKFVGAEGIESAGEKIKTAVTDFWEKIKEGISGWWENVKQSITDFIGKFAGTEGIESGGETIKTAVSDLWQKIKEGIGQWWTNVKASVTEFLGKIKTEISNIDLIQAAKDMINKFQTGITNAWEAFKKWFTEKLTGLFDIELPDWLTNLFGGKKPSITASGAKDRKSTSDKPDDSLNVVEMIAIDPITGIPQEVIDSFGALNTKIVELNTSIGTLNSSLGNSDGGLAFLLSGLELYISGIFTETLTTFATFIGVDGVLGSAITKLTQLFSMEGSTTALKQVLMLISDYISIDLTNTFTTFGTFIGAEGTFGQALNKLIKTLYEEGSETSLYFAFKKVTDYLSGEITTQITDFDTKLRTVFIPGWEYYAKILYYGDNTVYNALGAIQGVLESIEQMMQRVKDKIDYQLIPSFLRLADKSGEAEGALDTIAAAAQSVSYAMSSAANQVYALINAYAALQAVTDGMNVPVSKIQKDYTSNSVSKIGKDYPGHAEGGYVRAGRTILVGERGAELFTPHRNGWIIPNDEAFGSKSGSGKTINIEIHDIYGDANLEQRIRNGINQGLREAEFHGIGA